MEAATDAKFSVQETIEIENLLIFLLFIGCEKAYDNLNRNILWKIIQADNTPEPIEAINSSYKDTEMPSNLQTGRHQKLYRQKRCEAGAWPIPHFIQSMYKTKT